MENTKPFISNCCGAEVWEVWNCEEGRCPACGEPCELEIQEE